MQERNLVLRAWKRGVQFVRPVSAWKLLASGSYLSPHKSSCARNFKSAVRGRHGYLSLQPLASTSFDET